MAKYTYESLLNDNVQFLQGTQADLNLFLPSSTNTSKRGTAIEGAFYLTTDTHRLYVGRKVTTGTDKDKVFPEEISTGIATVVDSGALTDAQTGGAAHDGDFYYIKNSNVLAVYKENSDGSGSWIQINSPTGISQYNHSISSYTIADPELEAATKKIRIHSVIGTAGGDKTSDFYIKAGDNVTLKPGKDNQTIEISSANSQSTLKVSDTAVGADTNEAPIILTDGINEDTEVYFKGASDTTVQSEVKNGKNLVTITGPGVQGTKITQLGNTGATTGDTHGFTIGVTVKDGAKNATNDRTTVNSKLDPVITVGKASTSSHYFYGGQAKLDVYTSGEVDTKISSAITNALQDVDALHYRGLIDSSQALNALSDVEIGDVYKASATFTHNSVSIKTGDLLIAQGTEDSNGHITSTSLNWEVVPSGDEPLLQGKVFATTTDNPQFGLEDTHIAGEWSSLSGVEKASKRPLYVTVDNANSTLIKAQGTGSADDFKLTLHHTAPTSGLVTTITTPSTMVGTSVTGNDSLATKDSKVKFTALQSITRDEFGHITQIKGQEVTLKHNYLTRISASHSATDNVGKIVIGAEDTLGITNVALTKGSVQIGSDTLAISASDQSQLNVNLVWKSFS